MRMAAFLIESFLPLKMYGFFHPIGSIVCWIPPYRWHEKGFGHLAFFGRLFES